jgi:nucleoside-diphosphate-sugar epimerase
VNRRVIAVTGATGFLGLHLVAALSRAGAKIRILARRDPAHEFWSGIEYETIYGDLADEAALARLVDGADAVVHAAGLIKAQNRAAFLRVNRDGAAAVAKAARLHAPNARFVAVSTLAARMREISDYAFSKRAGEDAIAAVYAGAESQLTIIRPPVLYGPWDKATLSVFQTAALPIVPVLSRGRVTILHVTDAATALAYVALGAGESGLFALPGGNYTLAEVAAEAMRAQGRKASLLHVPGFLLRTAGAASGLWGRLRGAAPVFSVGKAREMLYLDWTVHAGEALPASVYQPAIGLEEGFASTVAWYRAHGWLR